MIEYKKAKKERSVRNFAIYRPEMDAIKVLREKGVNISDFLRYVLRTFSEQLRGDKDVTK